MNRLIKKLAIAVAVTVPLLAGAVDYDLNGDGWVDEADYELLTERIINQDAAYDAKYDINGDGIIDAVDANLLRSFENFNLRSYTVNGVSFKMVRVVGGTFTMGATAEQGSDAYSNEKPAHQVTLSSYCIGQTEVTQELWVAVMGSNPSDFTGNLQRPVEQVSWYDCQTFIIKLNQLTGANFRLPTEAEWEYAARGGNRSQGYKYSGSNTIGNVAWYYDNAYSVDSGSSNYGTHPVATKAPNELGLYDMSGNVGEWCQDWYGSYSSGAQTNPTGPTSGSNRVPRGGGWSAYAGGCRVSYRIFGSPSDTYPSRGLRLAL